MNVTALREILETMEKVYGLGIRAILPPDVVKGLQGLLGDEITKILIRAATDAEAAALPIEAPAGQETTAAPPA